MDVGRIDLFFRRGISFVTIIFGVAQLLILEKNIWIDGIFVICMAGVVGYYTNYLAIRMLFQPKQGKVLGWEGLVPKNKANIAKSLGESIQKNLLAPDILLEYVYEKKLIQKGTKRLEKWLDEILQNEDVRKKVTSKIIGSLQEKGPEILSQTFNLVEDTLKDIAGSPKEIEKLWVEIRKRIIEYIQSKENRETIVELIKKLVSEQIPELSIILNNAIDEYLKQKNTIGTIGFGIKKIISFDNNALQELLQEFIENDETTDKFLGVLDILVVDIQKKISSLETQEYILLKMKDWVDTMSKYSKDTILPAAIDRLQKFLEDKKNWEKIGDYSFKILDYAKEKLIEYMRSPEGSRYLKIQIGNIVHQINITHLVQEQVMKLDTDELEKMILDNTGGNLVMIQFLGGVLGLIAGFIQVHIYFALPVLGLTFLAWVSYYRNQKKFLK